MTDNSPRARTVRWELAKWDCPECGGELGPLDDRDPSVSQDDIWPDDGGFDEAAYDAANRLTTPVVICPDCGCDFDVRFEKREEKE